MAVTLIALPDKQCADKLKYLTEGCGVRLCKTPFGRGVEDRFREDVLPHHITLCAWKSSQRSDVEKKLAGLGFAPVSAKITKPALFYSSNGSFTVRLEAEPSKGLCELQKAIYSRLPNKQFDPSKISFHLTLHITKDKNEARKVLDHVSARFSPMRTNITELRLCEIYKSAEKPLISRFYAK